MPSAGELASSKLSPIRRPASTPWRRCACRKPRPCKPSGILVLVEDPRPGVDVRLCWSLDKAWLAAHRTPRSAQIPAASAECAVPPKTAISRNFRIPGFRLLQRQAEALPDLLLDDLRRGPRVHGVDVLLAPEDLQDGVGLVVIVPQPDRERLLGVIFPGDQLSAAHVAPAGDLRAVRDQVVVQPAVAAQPAVEDPAADLAVRQVKLDDAVDVVALQEELGLPR